jgi:aspartate-semialdehyde dehydrogenase
VVSRQIAEDVGVLGATSLVGESLLVLLKKKHGPHYSLYQAVGGAA